MMNSDRIQRSLRAVPARGVLAILLSVPLGGGLWAQSPPLEPYTLKRAVEEAWQKYPSLEAARAVTSAAASKVQVARDSYLPSASVHMQWNRATRNNVLGMMLPNQTIAPISGLVPNGVTGESTFGSAMGVLFSWTAYDFGTRRARIEAAEADRAETEARVALARYEIADAVVDAYFRAIAAEQSEAAAAATVERWNKTLEAVEVLVKTGLRPGADASRIRAELARAQAEQLLAQQQAKQAAAIVAQYLAEPEKGIAPVSTWALQPYTAIPAEAQSITVHPLLAIRQATISARTAEAAAVERAWYPKIDLMSAAYGRGTGARIDNTFRGGGAGLYPDTGNWAVGVGITVDVFNWKRFRTQREVIDHRVAGARAEELEAALGLRTLAEQARIALASAKAIAETTPRALSAARELLTQSDVRYRTGLGTITDLAEAQRTLRLAEVEDAVARINVWRAAYALSAAQGNIEGFLARLP